MCPTFTDNRLESCSAGCYAGRRLGKFEVHQEETEKMTGVEKECFADFLNKAPGKAEKIVWTTQATRQVPPYQHTNYPETIAGSSLGEDYHFGSLTYNILQSRWVGNMLKPTRRCFSVPWVYIYIYILDISCYLTSPVPIYATKMATKSQAFPGHVEPFKNGFLGSKLESTPSPIISIITFPTNPRFTGPQTFLVYKCRIVANCTWKYSWERYYS